MTAPSNKQAGQHQHAKTHRSQEPHRPAPAQVLITQRSQWRQYDDTCARHPILAFRAVTATSFCCRTYSRTGHSYTSGQPAPLLSPLSHSLTLTPNEKISPSSRYLSQRRPPKHLHEPLPNGRHRRNEAARFACSVPIDYTIEQTLSTDERTNAKDDAIGEIELPDGVGKGTEQEASSNQRGADQRHHLKRDTIGQIAAADACNRKLQA
jgi:hypothetical protein